MAAAPEPGSEEFCRYTSKKCWNRRALKRNGELHNLCEFHRQKANRNQRRLEKKRKDVASAASATVVEPSTAMPPRVTVHTSMPVRSPYDVPHHGVYAAYGPQQSSPMYKRPAPVMTHMSPYDHQPRIKYEPEHYYEARHKMQRTSYDRPPTPPSPMSALPPLPSRPTLSGRAGMHSHMLPSIHPRSPPLQRPQSSLQLPPLFSRREPMQLAPRSSEGSRKRSYTHMQGSEPHHSAYTEYDSRPAQYHSEDRRYERLHYDDARYEETRYAEQQQSYRDLPSPAREPAAVPSARYIRSPVLPRLMVPPSTAYVGAPSRYADERAYC
ncbi:TPA: hypothetical protein N0F65_001188 [Lagenidium giganteum]|uniref:Uncharacterized protein n=1 Tax=Lagenidium giganteum TaxID=4803 RepID=A0AAV2Z5K1_9STRA|nr:TPA: hypothetical protein N0F65_001188 [Lagenidium giganteum]